MVLINENLKKYFDKICNFIKSFEYLGNTDIHFIVKKLMHKLKIPAINDLINAFKNIIKEEKVWV